MATKMGALEKVYVRRMTNLLVERGKQVVISAIESKTSGNETLNQIDAYGLIVYYNGKVTRSMIGDVHSWTSNYKSPDPYNISERMTSKYKQFTQTEGDVHRGWSKMGVPDGTGYEWAKMFVREFGKTGEVPKTGFALVVFNAAFYSKIQEEGSGSLKRTYKILSQIIGDLDKIGTEFGGKPARKYNM